jgi:hypothetical protein
LDRDLLKAISWREGKHNFSSGSLTVENVMSDTHFVQITATTDYGTGQALLYALGGIRVAV